MAASALGQNLLWGKIEDRHKFRAKLVIAGESTAAVGYVIVYITHRTLLDNQSNLLAGISLIVGLSTLEFFWSMSDVGWAALLTDVTTTETRGRTVGALSFIASLGRMIGILFAGLLYANGDGFRQGTLFYIVTAFLLASTMIMWITSRSAKTQIRKPTKVPSPADTNEKITTLDKEQTYKWFLTSLVIIVIGASCIGQVFLLYLKLPQGLNATDPEMSLALTAWTIGGMTTSLLSGWLADKIGRIKVLLIGLTLAILTPLFLGSASNILTIAVVYGLNGVSFWTIQTAGFALAADLIHQDRLGKLFSRYNTVMALSWGPAGLLVGGPLADLQTQQLKLSAYTAYVNTFYASSIIVAIGTFVFITKVARQKAKKH
jgi:MFS family permease